jgi:FtsZ-binding cell division protein ZapB
MAKEETMSREEIMNAIEEGDRQTGILFEDIESKVEIALEDHARLDLKIDRVDEKLENFRRETTSNFNLVFEELYDMRNHFMKIDGKFNKIDKRFNKIDERFENIDQKFITIDENFRMMFERLDEIFVRFDRLEKTR